MRRWRGVLVLGIDIVPKPPLPPIELIHVLCSPKYSRSWNCLGAEERREVEEGARKSEGGIFEKHSSTAAPKNGKYLKP